MQSKSLNVVKGLAILSVAIFHITPVRGCSIYMLPIFFIIAGYCLNTGKIFTHFFCSKFRRLLIPYFVFGLIFTVLEYNGGGWRYFLSSGKLLIYGGQYLTGNFGTFWFINVLFLSLLIARIVKPILKKWSIWSLCLLCFVVAVYINKKDLNLPWSIQTIPLCLGYVFGGIGIRDNVPIESLDNLLKDRYWVSFISGLVLIVGVIILPHEFWMDIKYNDYGVGGVSIALSLLFCFFVFLFSSVLLLNNNVCIFLGWIGQGSLFFMYFHQFIHFQCPQNLNSWLILIITIVITLICYWCVGRLDKIKFIFGC